MRILVFDTETTGLPKSKILSPDTLNDWPHIVQFSYIIYDSCLNDIIDSKDYIVKLKKDIIISEESSKIHGITNEISLKKGISIHEILNEFFYYLRDVDSIIGHNISFDINMIKVELLRIIYHEKLYPSQLKLYKYDLHFITNYKNIVCTLKDSIQLCNIKSVDKFGRPYLKYPKLSELHEKLFEEIPNNLHNSFNDILVTLRCFMKLKHNHDLNETCRTFQNLVKEISLL
jgi:DNA polymerase III epsilon subunit-like protein